LLQVRASRSLTTAHCRDVRGVETFGNRVELVAEQMPVAVQGQCRGSMSEHRRHALDTCARCDRQRRGSVPKFVRNEALDSCCSRSGVKVARKLLTRNTPPRGAVKTSTRGRPTTYSTRRSQRNAGTGTDRTWCVFGVPHTGVPLTSVTASAISSRRLRDRPVERADRPPRPTADRSNRA
jgi:hypothetical protein